MTLDHAVFGTIGVLLGLVGWLGNRYLSGFETSISNMAEKMDRLEIRVENLETKKHFSRGSS